MIKRIINYIYKIIQKPYYNFKINSFGRNSLIINPLNISGKGISIGNNVFIQYKSWIECNPLTEEKKPQLIIEDGCTIGHFNEIYSTKCVILEKNVLTADRVYISDNLHGYENPDIPILRQPIKQNGTVRIGEGSWLGVGVAVIGANIGKHCVIGANAVVTHNIPDYSVAVGIPAKIIKRYNPQKKQWEKTDSFGNFIDK